MPITQSKEGLKRVIGIGGLVLAIVNGTLGAGIFVLQGPTNDFRLIYSSQQSFLIP